MKGLPSGLRWPRRSLLGGATFLRVQMDVTRETSMAEATCFSTSWREQGTVENKVKGHGCPQATRPARANSLDKSFRKSKDWALSSQAAALPVPLHHGAVWHWPQLLGQLCFSKLVEVQSAPEQDSVPFLLPFSPCSQESEEESSVLKTQAGDLGARIAIRSPLRSWWDTWAVTGQTPTGGWNEPHGHRSDFPSGDPGWVHP